MIYKLVYTHWSRHRVYNTGEKDPNTKRLQKVKYYISYYGKILCQRIGVLRFHGIILLTENFTKPVLFSKDFTDSDRLL